MPRPKVPRPENDPQKLIGKQNTVPQAPTINYTSGDSIRKALNGSSAEALKPALTALRNQWTIRHNEQPIPSDDSRLLLAKDYLERSPGASELFHAWDILSQQSNNHVHLALGAFHALLALATSHYIYHTFGQPLVQALLSEPTVRRLNGYLNSAQTELLLAVLKLWNVMSDFASGVHKKTVFEVFHWGNKTLSRFLHMRRKGQIGHAPDPFAKPDIRTLYILFLMSFVNTTTSHSVKSLFVEQCRDHFGGIFKGLAQDLYALVRRVLEVCWEGIWSDQRIKRTSKVALFGEQNLNYLLKLYARSDQEGSDAETIPADLVHHFFLAVLTRPGTGLCFKDRGWYPRDIQGDEEADQIKSVAKGQTKVFNKITSNILKNLRVGENSRQQELVLKVLVACPELASNFWVSAGLSLEPRLSSQWLINIAFAGTVISLPVPEDCFRLPGSQDYNPTPPPLSTVVDSIFPGTWGKVHITKGLQSISPLVQHSTAVCLARVLEKFEKVLQAFRRVETALLEDSGIGQWHLRINELEKEAKKRVPNFEVIVAFSQQKSSAAWASEHSKEHGARKSMISEIGLRLMWLYHRSLPSIPAEARYDIGKLLFSPAGQQLIADGGGVEEISTQAPGLATLSQLHLLRLFHHSGQFAWWTTFGDTQQTYIYHLLRLHSTANHDLIKAECAPVIQNLLGPSILFEHDPQELDIWLSALPRSLRFPDAKSPDGAALLDEKSSVLSVVDEALKRCLKSPYKYVESVMEFAHNSSPIPTGTSYGPPLLPSSLLMAVIEVMNDCATGVAQAPPSALLAMATYIRRVIFGLHLKQPNTQYSRRILEYIISLRIPNQGTLTSHPAISTGILREWHMLTDIFDALDQSYPPMNESNPAVENFTHHLEQMAIEEAKVKHVAYQLIDWVRLVNQPIGHEHIVRLAILLKRWHPPALPEFFLQVGPRSARLASLVSHLDHMEDLEFPWSYASTRPVELLEPEWLNTLARAGSSGNGWMGNLKLVLRSLHQEVVRATTFLDSPLEPKVTLLHGLFNALPPEKQDLARGAIFESFAINGLFRLETLSTVVSTLPQALSRLLKCLVSQSPVVEEASRDYRAYWLLRCSEYDGILLEQRGLLLCPWLSFMPADELFTILDHCLLLSNSGGLSSTVLRTIISVTLESVSRRCLEPLTIKDACDRLPKLIKLRLSAPDLSNLRSFIHIFSSALVPFGLDAYDASTTRQAKGLLQRAESRWKSSMSRVSPELIDSMTASTEDFEFHGPWLYRSSLVRKQFIEYLYSLPNGSIPDQLLCPLHVVIAARQVNEFDLQPLAQKFVRYLTKRAFEDSRDEFTVASQGCIRRLLDPSNTVAIFVAEKVIERAEKTQHCAFLAFVSSLADEKLLAASQVAQVVEASASGITSLLSSVHLTSAEKQDIAAYGRLCSLSSTLRGHIIEPVLNAAIIRHQLDSEVMLTLGAIARVVSLKPATANRVLQAILHSEAFSDAASNPDSRGALVNAVHALFYLHPSNTCQPSHIAPLISVYRGTLDTPDLNILSLFQLFERERRYSCGSIMARWPGTTTLSHSGALDALASLEAARVARLYTTWPVWRGLRACDPPKEDATYDGLYDPVFVLLLLGQVLADDKPKTTLDVIRIFRSNAPCVVTLGLSSKHEDMRGLSWAILGGLAASIESLEFSEKAQTLYTLSMLRKLPASIPGQAPRLPTYATLFFAHALRTIFDPATFVYPLISSFLLQRPEFDQHDVPMFYATLFSAGDEWKKDRGWILRYLANGMLSTADWRVLKRRHVWDLLATMYQSSRNDKGLCIFILKVLLSLSRSQQAATSLILRSGLLGWIEIQALESTAEEDYIWWQILDNVLLVTQGGKLDNATSKQWRPALSRIICTILRRRSSMQTLRIAVRVIRRMSNLADVPAEIAKCVMLALEWVRLAEQELDFSLASEDSSMNAWVEIIENLWESTMQGNEQDGGVLGTLSARLLIVHSRWRGRSASATWLHGVVCQQINAG